MRLTTLRALLLVLAMVIQTVAGGAGLARAASMSPEEALSAQCHRLRVGEQSAPNKEIGHGRHCHACLMCGEPPAAWISPLADYVIPIDEYALIDSPSFAGRALSERPSRAHSARAPPLSRA